MNPFFFLILCVFTIDLSASLDLDKMQQSFVLETKRIHIPDYPDAFNPSIVRWNDSILMTFRSRDPSTGAANRVGFIWLDEHFNPKGKATLLKSSVEGENTYIQDPRLIVIKDKLYIAYSDLVKQPKAEKPKRLMCLAEISYDGNTFSTVNRDCIYDFEGDINNKFEKNWVPFNYQDILLLAYSIAPHKVFLPLLGQNRCATIAESTMMNRWEWGILRGGTPALLIDKNHYLAFFHSSIPIATVQSNSQSMPHYFMGAYLFDSHPPFSLRKMSPNPIVTKDFYTGESYPTWKPLNVVFPCGFIFDTNYIWISYGRQDYEAWIVKLDKSALLKSLIPVESNL